MNSSILQEDISLAKNHLFLSEFLKSDKDRSSLQDTRHLQFNRVGRNVEFVLHPQHEASFYLEKRPVQDFKQVWKATWKFVDSLFE